MAILIVCLRELALALPSGKSDAGERVIELMLQLQERYAAGIADLEKEALEDRV